MKVKYFHDPTTALIEFSTHIVAETKEINENIHIISQRQGNPRKLKCDENNLLHSKVATWVNYRETDIFFKSTKSVLG